MREDVRAKYPEHGADLREVIEALGICRVQVELDDTLEPVTHFQPREHLDSTAS